MFTFSPSCQGSSLDVSEARWRLLEPSGMQQGVQAAPRGGPCEGHLLFSDLLHRQMLNSRAQKGHRIDIPVGLNRNAKSACLPSSFAHTHAHPTDKSRATLHPWVLSYSRGRMRRPWQASQMSPPLLPKAPRCQKETPDWKDREMLICYSVCEPVNKEAAHRDARSLTFYIHTVSNQVIAVVVLFSSKQKAAEFMGPSTS